MPFPTIRSPLPLWNLLDIALPLYNLNLFQNFFLLLPCVGVYLVLSSPMWFQFLHSSFSVVCVLLLYSIVFTSFSFLCFAMTLFIILNMFEPHSFFHQIIPIFSWIIVHDFESKFTVRADPNTDSVAWGIRKKHDLERQSFCCLWSTKLDKVKGNHSSEYAIPPPLIVLFFNNSLVDCECKEGAILSLTFLLW